MKSQEFNRTKLYFSAFTASLLYLSTGCALTWPSPEISKLSIDESKVSWVVALVALGAMLGPLMYTLGIDSIGRKKTLILNGLVFLLSSTILAISNTNEVILYTGRFISGIGVGCTFNIIPVYISEISDERVRQTLTSFCEFFIGIGYLMSYCIGPKVSYVCFNVVCAIPCVVFLVLMIFLPESPYYLVKKAKWKEFFDALAWLRPGADLTQTIQDIKDEVSSAESDNGKFKELFCERVPRKALLLSLFMLTIQQMSAIDVITSYTNNLVQGYNATIILGVLNLAFSALAPPFVHKLGAKKVFVAFAFLTGIILCLFAVYLYFEDSLKDYNYIALICLVIFNLCFCIGVGAQPWAISSELFPPHLKGWAIFVSSSFAWFVAFVELQLYEYIDYTYNVHYPQFFFFGSMMLVGSLLIGILVPNTTGVTLQQVQQLLAK